MKRALLTGASGQLAYYLHGLLLWNGYSVIRQGKFQALPGGPFDEVYLLHIVRPLEEISLEEALRNGTLEVAKYIDAYPEAKILVPDSQAAKERKGPLNWVKDKTLTRDLVRQFCPRVVMPTLSQYISSRGNPKRMYLMQILYELASGVEPSPLKPDEWCFPLHAKEGALSLFEGMRGNWAAVPTAKALRIREFIELAKDPKSWVGEIVEELKKT